MMRVSVVLTVAAFVVSACRPPCATDADCGEGQFCEAPIGECGGNGNCTNIRSDIACRGTATLDLAVCGCDGTTYESDCFRREAAVSKRHEGRCECADDHDCAAAQFCEQPTGLCSGPGSCTWMPSDALCTGTGGVDRAVCSCEGFTFESDCWRRAGGVSKASEGRCD